MSRKRGGGGVARKYSLKKLGIWSGLERPLHASSARENKFVFEVGGDVGKDLLVSWMYQRGKLCS